METALEKKRERGEHRKQTETGDFSKLLLLPVGPSPPFFSSPTPRPTRKMPSTASASPLPLPASPLREDPFRSLHHHFSRLASDLSSTLHFFTQTLLGNASNTPRATPRLPLLFASTSQPHGAAAAAGGRHAFDVALSAEQVARTLKGTAVYTVSNADNEFVLITDPNNSMKSLGLLCFRQEDAKALLAQVQLKQPALGRGAKVVPITLDQVYMLKVEGIAFRFLPDPRQIKNALELKSADFSSGFDGVPVFQADNLVVKKKNRRYCPVYFRKEDIEWELEKVSRRGTRAPQNIMVGSLEDVLKRMEVNKKKSGWDDLIFIPPGKSYVKHIGEVSA